MQCLNKLLGALSKNTCSMLCFQKNNRFPIAFCRFRYLPIHSIEPRKNSFESLIKNLIKTASKQKRSYHLSIADNLPVVINWRLQKLAGTIKTSFASTPEQCLIGCPYVSGWSGESLSRITVSYRGGWVTSSFDLKFRFKH